MPLDIASSMLSSSPPDQAGQSTPAAGQPQQGGLFEMFLGDITGQTTTAAPITPKGHAKSGDGSSERNSFTGDRTKSQTDDASVDPSTVTIPALLIPLATPISAPIITQPNNSPEGAIAQASAWVQDPTAPAATTNTITGIAMDTGHDASTTTSKISTAGGLLPQMQETPQTPVFRQAASVPAGFATSTQPVPTPVATSTPVGVTPTITSTPITATPIEVPTPISANPIEVPTAPISATPIETPAPVTVDPITTPIISPFSTGPISATPIETPAPVTVHPITTPIISPISTGPISATPIQAPAPVKVGPEPAPIINQIRTTPITAPTITATSSTPQYAVDFDEVVTPVATSSASVPTSADQVASGETIAASPSISGMSIAASATTVPSTPSTNNTPAAPSLPSSLTLGNLGGVNSTARATTVY